MSKTSKRIFKVLRWTGKALVTFLLLLVMLLFALRLPFVQKFITDKALGVYSSKVQTPARLGGLYLDFPSKLVVRELYLESQASDTLVYFDRLNVSANLLGLFNNRLQIDDVSIYELTGNIHRNELGIFNFQYIVDAFSGNEDRENTSEPMKIGLGHAGIFTTHIAYTDAYEGMSVEAHIGDLEVSTDKFDLEESIISVDYLLLQDSRAYLRMFEPAKATQEETSENTDESGSKPFQIDGNFAELQRVKFRMDDETGGMSMSSEVENLQVEIDSLDINQQVYLARKINMESPFVSLEFISNSSDSVSAGSEDAGEPIQLTAGADEINLNKGKFRLWDHSQEELPGFDPAHMWFDELSLQTEQVRYENENVYARIDQVTGTDLRNRKRLSKFSGELAYTDSVAFAKGLRATFENTHIESDISVTYDGKEDLANFSEDTNMQVALQNTTIVPGDLSYFAPMTFIPEDVKSEPLEVSGKVQGSPADLSVNEFAADWNQQHVIIPAMHLIDILDFPNSEIEASGIEIAVNPSILSLIDADSLSNQFDLPVSMNIQTEVFYRRDSMRADVHFNSPDGDFTLDGNGRMAPDSVLLFIVDLGMDEFEVGKILRQDDLGSISMNARSSGSGHDLPSVMATVEVNLEELGYRGYTYEGLEVIGEVAGESFDGQVSYSDDNLDFQFDGLVGFQEGSQRQKFDLQINRADLQALNFSEEEFRFLGKLHADLEIDENSDLSGELAFTEVGVNRAGDRYDVDTLRLVANDSAGVRMVHVNSDFLEATLSSTFPLVEIPEVVFVYYEDIVSDSANRTSQQGKAFDINVRIRDTDLLSDVLIPDLEFLEISPLAVSFDGTEQVMQADVTIDSAKYGNFMINGLSLSLDGNYEDLFARLDWQRLRSGPLLIEHFIARAQSEEEGVRLNVQVRNQLDSVRYNLSTYIDSDSVGGYRLAFHPDSVMLNYEEWLIPHSNQVTFGEGNFWIQDFEFRKNQQAIKLQSSTGNSQDTLVLLTADNFELSELANLAGDSIPTLSGVLDGNVDYNVTTTGFEADMDISDFIIRGFEVGNVNLFSEKSALDTYNANLEITGKGNELKFEGEYNTTGDIQASLDIGNLNLEPIEPISSGSLTDVDGTVRGEFDVTGTVGDPKLSGLFVFDDVSFIVAMVNEKFAIGQEELRIENNVFQFSKFTLRDTRQRSATIDGKVSTDNFLEFDLDFHIETEEFTLLNSTEEDNELFYGRVAATSELDVKGTNLRPDVSLNLTLSDDSRITYVIPESTITAQLQSDVVVFVDKDEGNTEFLGRKTARDSLLKTVAGMNLDAVVTVPENAELKIVVDPISGDALTVKGSALLNLGIRPSGDITMTGRYEVNEGSYHMDFYGLVQRDFEIQKGSFILWTGNIFEALLNITAVYKTRARPVQTANTERLNFDVQLILTGQLLQPEISFKIDLEEGSPAPIEVQSWIAQLNQDKSQLNKQAFGLLVFNSFFDDTGQSGSWYDNLAQNTARSSVSSFLSSELNKLSDKIEGVELSFDLSSYEDFNSQGENVGRTQLELGLSKQFFDDRLIVKFAGNFDLEGKSAYRNNVSDFTGDIQVEYLMTEDGRYRLLGFRETNYDDLLQGEIIRAGLGVIFVRDYDTLKELFNKSNKNKQVDEKE